MPPDDFTTEFTAAPPPPRGQQPITALLADLVRQLGLLFRQEMALLRAELGEKFGRLGQGAVALAAGVLLTFSGWLVLLAAAVLGLAHLVAAWLAALIVGFVVVAFGGIALYVGKRRLAAASLVPQRTLHSLHEDEIRLKQRVMS